MTETASITITQKENYQFLVDFGGAIPGLLVDEPAPMGAGTGPEPAQMLMAAAANCLSASLLFSLKKYGQDAGGITTTATCTIDRNANNRLRVLHIDVMIQFAQDGANIQHLDRVLGQFEEFCTVSQSIQAGIPIKVSVTDGKGISLK
ncbi:MAG: OsmC family protein [Burkholderiaceae bacterium]